MAVAVHVTSVSLVAPKCGLMFTEVMMGRQTMETMTRSRIAFSGPTLQGFICIRVHLQQAPTPVFQPSLPVLGIGHVLSRPVMEIWKAPLSVHRSQSRPNAANMWIARREHTVQHGELTERNIAQTLVQATTTVAQMRSAPRCLDQEMPMSVNQT